MKKWLLLTASLTMAAAAAAGCGKESASSEVAADTGKSASAAQQVAPPWESKEPITLHVVWSGSKQQYSERVENPRIKAKMPNVTFEFHALGDGLEKMLTAGIKPDVVNVTPQVFYDLQRLNMTTDMAPYIKKYGFNMDRFVPGHVDIIKSYSDKGELFGLPGKVNFPYVNHGLAYNKEIFDRLNVPYPKDNMTWDEVITLAKQLNRTDGGIQYKGLFMDIPEYMMQQLALSYTNKAGKADLSAPGWAEIFRLHKRAFDELGNVRAGDWAKDQNIAMFAGRIRNFIDSATINKDSMFKWDVATYPTFKEAPNTVPPVLGVYAITSISEHKDAAFRLVTELLSDELGQDEIASFLNPEFKVKNVKSVRDVKQALYKPGEFDSVARPIVNKKINELLNGKDVNTAIREAQEEMQKAVDASKK
jgi:multiple sugar transport system substrate-binding protein